MNFRDAFPGPFGLALLAAIALVAAPARAEDATPARGVAAVLQPLVDSHSLAGAVTLVADKDKVLDLDAIGFADVDAKRPMRTDSLFWIASQSKPITATALMILVDEGKVKLDDPVSKYLPEFGDIWVATERDNDHMVLKRPRHPINVREILSHTSGLPFASRVENPTLDGRPLREAVVSYAMTPLQSEPGAKYQYSNAGINSAGRIIEVVSGMPYEKFLDERLFGPLGMKDTTFWPNAEQLTRIAEAYKPNASKDGLEKTTISQLTYPLDGPNRYPMPAGGLFSTASDVGRFCRMLLNGGTLDGKRYLSEDAVNQMATKQTGDEVKDQYGLGWAVGGDGFGHGGALATDMAIDRKRGLVTVYLIQAAGFPGEGGQGVGRFKNAAMERFGAK